MQPRRASPVLACRYLVRQYAVDSRSITRRDEMIGGFYFISFLAKSNNNNAPAHDATPLVFSAILRRQDLFYIRQNQDVLLSTVVIKRGKQLQCLGGSRRNLATFWLRVDYKVQLKRGSISLGWNQSGPCFKYRSISPPHCHACPAIFPSDGFDTWH